MTKGRSRPPRPTVAARSQHPLVRQFVESSEPLEIVAQRMPEPLDPVAKVIVDFTRVKSGGMLYADVCARAEKLELGGIDPDLHIILLDVWAGAAIDSGPYPSPQGMDQVRALTNMARSLVSERTPPEIKFLVLTMESYTGNVGGNLARRAEILDEIRRVLPPTSPRHAIGVLNCLWNAAMQGQLVEQEESFASLRGRSEHACLLRLIEFTNLVETGRRDEAARMRPTMGNPGDPEWRTGYLARHVGSLRWLTALLTMMNGDHSLEGAYRALGFADPSAPDFAGANLDPAKLPVWVWIWHHLLERRPEQALERARAEAADWGRAYFTSLGPMPLNLCRTELACGHAEAARQSLEKRRSLGNIRYIDDFFLARLALLEGDRETAARHFAMVMVSCERYRARGRLDFELQMACELSPADLVWLGQAAAGVKLGKPIAPAREAPARPKSMARGIARLVGESRALSSVRESILRMAAWDAPVLVTGETGTGKELVARALHEAGPRGSEPFLAVNCGAITESLLESELFGHEKGAFTGAAAAHRGLFEEAARGTLLLDEIGDMPPRLQVAILRVLETGEVRPVGSSRTRRVACRIVAATNADLEALVREGRFRQDLLYRLKRLEIFLPPLGERPDDILPLAESFLAEGRRDGLRPAMAPEVQRWLLAQKWPGNVRELRNAMERLRLLGSEKLLYGPDDLAAVRPPEATAAGPSASPAPSFSTTSFAPKTKASSPSPAGGDGVGGGGGLRLHSHMRRLDRSRELFRQHGKLMRAELADMLGVTLCTAGKYVAGLIAEGLIEKVEPTRSPRTHYFRLRPPSP